MVDKERKWSVDWRTFNWKVVDKEIEEKKPQNEEDITTLTRDMFVEYLHWLNENEYYGIKYITCPETGNHPLISLILHTVLCLNGLRL